MKTLALIVMLTLASDTKRVKGCMYPDSGKFMVRSGEVLFVVESCDGDYYTWQVKQEMI